MLALAEMMMLARWGWYQTSALIFQDYKGIFTSKHSAQIWVLLTLCFQCRLIGDSVHCCSIGDPDWCSSHHLEIAGHYRGKGHLVVVCGEGVLQQQLNAWTVISLPVSWAELVTSSPPTYVPLVVGHAVTDRYHLSDPLAVAELQSCLSQVCRLLGQPACSDCSR